MEKRPFARGFLALIRFYQWFSRRTPRHCRFYPTCSQYAYGAIERYGVRKGGKLAFLRLMKCHPWHPGGYDPVL